MAAAKRRERLLTAEDLRRLRRRGRARIAPMLPGVRPLETAARPVRADLSALDAGHVALERERSAMLLAMREGICSACGRDCLLRRMTHCRRRARLRRPNFHCPSGRF